MGGQHRDKVKQREREKAWRKANPEKVQQYLRGTKMRKQIEAAIEPRQASVIVCPHCAGSVPLPENSTFVMNKHHVGEDFRVEDYKSNPNREYKRPEKDRRRQLAYYWRNREKILAGAKERRAMINARLAEN